MGRRPFASRCSRARESLLLAPALVGLGAYRQDEPEPVTLRFGWPPEGQVQVREESLKKGRTATTTYTLEWEPAEDGSGTELRYHDFEFVAIEGLDLENPLVIAGLAEARALAAAIPTLRVDAEGYLDGFLGFDELLERMQASPLFQEDSEEVRTKVRAALEQPEVRSVIETKVADIWNSWVGCWVALEVVRGTSETVMFDTEETGGVVPEVVFRYGERSRYRGLECVEINWEGRADEELLRRRTLEFMGVIAQGAGTELPDDMPIARMARTDTKHGIIAVGGLRPIEVETSSVVQVWENGADEPLEQVERHRYLFAWSDLGSVDEDD